MSDPGWMPIDTAPLNREVITKIDDDAGERRETPEQIATRIADKYLGFDISCQALYNDVRAIITADRAANAARIEKLQDKVDGLEADLDSAVRVAFHRGAVEWTRLNYRSIHDELVAQDAARSTLEGK